LTNGAQCCDKSTGRAQRDARIITWACPYIVALPHQLLWSHNHVSKRRGLVTNHHCAVTWSPTTTGLNATLIATLILLWLRLRVHLSDECCLPRPMSCCNGTSGFAYTTFVATGTAGRHGCCMLKQRSLQVRMPITEPAQRCCFHCGPPRHEDEWHVVLACTAFSPPLKS
jgi:hypothetical protein